MKLKRTTWLSTTPGRVRAGVVLIIVLAVALGIVAMVSFASTTSGFSQIGGTSAPLVEDSTGLYLAVNDMDAQVANVLLAGDNSQFAAGRAQDQTFYAADEHTADSDLRQITVTAAGDPRAQADVGTIMDALGRYEALAANAMQLDRLGSDPAGTPDPQARASFEQATDLMTGQILPAISTLTSTNQAALTSSYTSDRRSAEQNVDYLVISGSTLLAALLILQVFLNHRYHRVFNPVLLLATVLAAGFTAAATAGQNDQHTQLFVAKSQAFDSIVALSQARAISYAANADESRFLVDAPRAARYQASFLAESQQVAEVATADIVHYDAGLAADIDAYAVSNATIDFGGYLGAEFRNITFPGERAAAEQALRAWQMYHIVDRQLRTIAATDLDAAIALDVGTQSGQSDFTFSQWDAALQGVIKINQDAFDNAIATGHSDGSGWNGPIPAALVVTVAGLAVAGTWRRVAEYR